jgi:pimeloyl-ACP methyl ester carboxylesterase
MYSQMTTTDGPTIRTRQVRWSWQGQDVTLGVDEAGDGPAILLLPALSSISIRREVHALMRQLADRAHLVATDWPGFGDQPRPPMAWTPDALSSFLEWFVRQEVLALHATVASGHAAAYALDLAARRTTLLGRLVLLAPTRPGPLPTMVGGDRRWFSRIRVGMPVLGPALYRLNVNPPVIHMMVAGHVYGEARALPAAWWEQKQAVIAAPGARFASVAFVTGGLDRVKSREAFLNLARAVQGPLLVAYGGETPPKSRPEIDALAALPSVQSVMTAAGKLALYEEYPD